VKPRSFLEILGGGHREYQLPLKLLTRNDRKSKILVMPEMQISLGQANAAHKVFKARIRAERIESRAQ
jgi:hypothetical protein